MNWRGAACFVGKGSGLRVSGVGLRVSGFRFTNSCLGFGFQGSEFRLQCLGVRVEGYGFRGSGFRIRVRDLGFRALGFLVFSVLGLVLESSVVVGRFQSFSFLGLRVRINPQ